MKAGDWYCKAIQAVCQYGLVKGYQDGTFRPGQAITREEAFVIVASGIKLAGMNINTTDADQLLDRFKDKANIDNWARNATALCIDYDIIIGNNSSLSPDDNITRAETAAIIMKTLREAKLI
ncbi:MAG: S-layer homology domain-containing protein [Syntrophomonas sp.]